MTIKRWLLRDVKLEKNYLPLNIDVINHYYYSRKLHSESKLDFLNEMPGFNDVKNEVVNDTIRIWQAAGLPIISHSRIQIKFKHVGDKFEGAKKTAYVRQKETTLVSEDWLDKLFDICTYTCEFLKIRKYLTTRFYIAAHGKTIPKEELPFLSD